MVITDFFKTCMSLFRARMSVYFMHAVSKQGRQLQMVCMSTGNLTQVLERSQSHWAISPDPHSSFFPKKSKASGALGKQRQEISTFEASLVGGWGGEGQNLQLPAQEDDTANSLIKLKVSFTRQHS